MRILTHCVFTLCIVIFIAVVETIYFICIRLGHHTWASFSIFVDVADFIMDDVTHIQHIILHFALKFYWIFLGGPHFKNFNFWSSESVNFVPSIYWGDVFCWRRLSLLNFIMKIFVNDFFINNSPGLLKLILQIFNFQEKTLYIIYMIKLRRFFFIG